MPRINFQDVDDIKPLDPDRFEPVPAGVYTCTVVSVLESKTQHGNEMWRLKFRIEDGPHSGLFLWDNLPFSNAALPRVKLAFDALGLDTSSEVDIGPDAVIGRSCSLTVKLESYEGKSRNKIAFAGYEATGK